MLRLHSKLTRLSVRLSTAATSSAISARTSRQCFRTIQQFSTTIESSYVRKTPIEHILLRPGMYIGQTEIMEEDVWVYNHVDNAMEKRLVSYSPGMFKIFDEILINAGDNYQRDKKMTTIAVDVHNRGDHLEIVVENDGTGIPIQYHKKEKMYIPELIFGHLLTGSNFDDKIARLTGGTHGYGAKLSNIFSTKFAVEIFNHKKKLLYKQEWSSNMSLSKPPEIVENHNGPASDYTKITFQPDLSRLGFHNISNSTEKGRLVADAVTLLHRRTVDIAGCLSTVNVYWNGNVIPVKSFEDYSRLFSNSTEAYSSSNKSSKTLTNNDLKTVRSNGAVDSNYGESVKAPPILYEKVNSRWEIALLPSPTGSFENVSFVNNIQTSKGGTHVNHAIAPITKVIDAALKSKGITTTQASIKNKIMLLVNCQIENATFDGQMKDTLTTRSTAFGSSCEYSKTFLKSVVKDSGIVEAITAEIAIQEKAKLLSSVSKPANSKQLLEISKLEDAHLAGSGRSHECTLILTEGDSAKALAVAGLEVVGRDKYGVLPLRGKVLNARSASKKMLLENKELIDLCKVLGLDFNKKYTTDIRNCGLRYGKVMLMCDQDIDGSHIKGLIINFFHYYFPNLLKSEGFLQQFVTPIIKVKYKNKKLNNNQVEIKPFYSLQEYNAWMKSHTKSGESDGKIEVLNVKYYKGLGTSTAIEGKEYFKGLVKNKKVFYYDINDKYKDDDAIDLAFNKTRSSDRRNWLNKQYDPNYIIDNQQTKVSFSDFVNYELIQFSIADNVRSIPSVIDGLKPSQRKVLYGCFKKGIKDEIKVAQLSGYISEQTAYHHGEISLQNTIINMAQDFVGSNNLPLLRSSGQFGTRAHGGADHASARYLFTQLSPITRLLFPEEDDNLLTYVEEDGQTVEPKYFVPVLPLLLLNGTYGIGTGWMTKIPSYNIHDVIKTIEQLIRGESIKEPLAPWIRGFNGVITKQKATNTNTNINNYISQGIIKRINNTTLEISELPYEIWTDNYKSFLYKLIENKQIKSFKEYHTSTNIKFIISGMKKEIDDLVRTDLIKNFKLTSNILLDNMYAFNKDGIIVNYLTPENIISDHYDVRLELYFKRKQRLLQQLMADELLKRNKSKFIQFILNKELSLFDNTNNSGQTKTENSIANDMKKLQLLTLDEINSVRNVSNSSLIASKKKNSSKANSSDSSGSSISNIDYSYLLEMPIQSLTEARSIALKREAEIAAQKLKHLQAKTELDLWQDDINAIKAQLEREKY